MSEELEDLSDDDLEALLETHASFDPGPCRVCGAGLELQAMGPGTFAAWAHSTPEGMSAREWGDHYRDSRVESYRKGDPRVRNLIAEVRRRRATDSGSAEPTSISTQEGTK